MRQLARGERNGRAKLTCEQALDIYLLARSGLWWQREIAERFAITQSEVSLLMHRRRWQHLFYNNDGNPMTEDELKAELEALKKRQTELEAKLGEDKPPAPQFKREPYQPRDYTAGASMDRETMRDLAKAFPPDLVRDLRADARRPNPVTEAGSAQLTPDRPGRVEIRGTGWAEPNPLRQPAGVDICDRIMDAADRQDRADLERRLARSVKPK
jgi:hypothetical protein